MIRCGPAPEWSGTARMGAFCSCALTLKYNILPTFIFQLARSICCTRICFFNVFSFAILSPLDFLTFKKYFQAIIVSPQVQLLSTKPLLSQIAPRRRCSRLDVFCVQYSILAVLDGVGQREAYSSSILYPHSGLVYSFPCLDSCSILCDDESQFAARF